MSLPKTSLSLEGLTRLGGLLAGLDRLDVILKCSSVCKSGNSGVEFGRFRILRQIGAGRFGVVLLADDPLLRRQVVVKVPQAVVLADRSLRLRFVREARSAARLDHPGIVPVFEAGEDEGLPYLVAGYVDGPTLAGWLARRKGPVSPDTAVRLVAKLAAAVQHAHERGVLHCDLTPSNILLSSADAAVPEPVVTDFGLARLVEDDPALTRTYQVAGTPLYMAPEQARGERRSLTARADVYALGVILYELLVGELPFTAGNTDRILFDVVNTPPRPPRQVNRGVPRDLEAVCLKCLEKEPANRYATADALANDLQRYLAGRSTSARPVGTACRVWRAVRRRPVMAALTVVAALAVSAIPAVAAWYSMRLDREATARQRAEYDAFRDREQAATQEFFTTLERVRVRRLEQPPRWSDENLGDLRRLAALPQAASHLADLRSEAAAALNAIDLRPVVTLAEGFLAYAPAYSPDGSILALGGWQPLPDGRGVVRLFSPKTGTFIRELTFEFDPDWARKREKPDGCRTVAFSPDGNWLVVGTRGGQCVRWRLVPSIADPQPVVWDAHVEDHTSLSRVVVSALVFSADGKTLYSSSQETTQAWDVGTDWRPVGSRGRYLLPTGTSVVTGPLVGRRKEPGTPGGLVRIGGKIEYIRQQAENVSETFTSSRDGRMAAGMASPTDSLCLIGTDPGLPPVPLRNPGRYGNWSFEYMGFSPDTALLATGEESERRIKLWDVASGVLVADRAVSGGSGRFAFSPDGRHLAVTEQSKTVVYEVVGKVQETLAVGPRRYIETIAVSPDGNDLLTQHGADGLGLEQTLWDVRPWRQPVPRARQDYSHFGSFIPGADFHPQKTGYAVTLSEKNVLDPNAKGERVASSDTTFTRCETINHLRFAPDGRLWAAGADRVHVWTLPTWEEELPLENDQESIDQGMVFRAVAPGRRLSVVGRRDGLVFLLPAAGPNPPARKVFDSGVTSLALSPDEKQVLVGGERGELVILSVADGATTVVKGAHSDAVQSVAYGPGGWFVTGSADQTIKFWDAAGQPVLSLRTGGGVRKLSVSADGFLLTVLIDSERAVRRWRLDRLSRALADLALPLDLSVPCCLPARPGAAVARRPLNPLSDMARSVRNLTLEP